MKKNMDLLNQALNRQSIYLNVIFGYLQEFEKNNTENLPEIYRFIGKDEFAIRKMNSIFKSIKSRKNILKFIYSFPAKDLNPGVLYKLTSFGADAMLFGNDNVYRLHKKRYITYLVKYIKMKYWNNLNSVEQIINKSKLARLMFEKYHIIELWGDIISSYDRFMVKCVKKKLWDGPSVIRHYTASLAYYSIYCDIPGILKVYLYVVKHGYNNDVEMYKKINNGFNCSWKSPLVTIMLLHRKLGDREIYPQYKKYYIVLKMISTRILSKNLTKLSLYY
jgi:hypothetical protein